MKTGKSRINVAWLMISHRRARFAVSLLGVAFAVVIMFMEIGFSNGINDSQARLATYLDADLVMIVRGRYSLVADDDFDHSRLQQVLSVEGVASAIPLYEGTQVVADPQTGMFRAIAVIAFPPGTAPLKIRGLAEISPQLARRGNILFDRLSREIYGDIRVGAPVMLGLEAQEHHVIGVFELGPSIRTDGLILMGDNSWLSSRRESDRPTMGLIKIAPGASLKAVRERVLKVIGDENYLFTPEELRVREVKFVASASPAAAIFTVGLIVGLIIGVIICYQILFNEIADNLPQYATIRAIGFPTTYLVRLVMKQAMMLAFFGFLPGVIAAFGLYALIEGETRILMILNWQRITLILTLTILMCGISGMLAVKKVLRADPADVF